MIDLTGKKFGRWFVIGRDFSSSHIKPYWTCECDCGTIRSVNGCSLRGGLSGSCGCLKRDNKIVDISGKRFGYLTAIKCLINSPTPSGFPWECLCDCGNTFIADGHSLRLGRVKSCGCQWHPRGKDSHLWKGSERKVKDNRSSIEYKEWRFSVFERDDFICQSCGNARGLNAHHVKSYKGYPKLRTTKENGITLCVECHKAFHKEYGRYKFTSEDFWSWLKVQEDLNMKMLEREQEDS